MAVGRSAFSIISLILVAGAIVLQFLVILSGATYGSPENQIFFLETTTNGIPNAPNPARWTFFQVCGVNAAGKNANCLGIHPALPFQPQHRTNFGTARGVPAAFLFTSQYWYESRFMFAFYLIALFFAVVSFFAGFLALCTRLGAYLSGMTAIIALIFQTIAAALMTAWTVSGRNAFMNAGQDANLGVKAFAFTWSTVVCFFLSSVLFCLAGSSGKSSDNYNSGRGGLFARNRRSVRSQKSGVSRGSFIDSERSGMGGRIKDEYE